MQDREHSVEQEGPRDQGEAVPLAFDAAAGESDDERVDTGEAAENLPQL